MSIFIYRSFGIFVWRMRRNFFLHSQFYEFKNSRVHFPKYRYLIETLLISLNVFNKKYKSNVFRITHFDTLHRNVTYSEWIKRLISKFFQKSLKISPLVYLWILLILLLILETLSLFPHRRRQFMYNSFYIIYYII